jgi:flagellar biosynthesis GTPase FlhF
MGKYIVKVRESLKKAKEEEAARKKQEEEEEAARKKQEAEEKEKLAAEAKAKAEAEQEAALKTEAGARAYIQKIMNEKPDRKDLSNNEIRNIIISYNTFMEEDLDDISDEIITYINNFSLEYNTNKIFIDKLSEMLEDTQSALGKSKYMVGGSSINLNSELKQIYKTMKQNRYGHQYFNSEINNLNKKYNIKLSISEIKNILKN